eukprot:s1955_g4.t1
MPPPIDPPTAPTPAEPAPSETAPRESTPAAVLPSPLPSPPLVAKAMPQQPPQAGEIKFQPVTAKGMQAFFAVLRRPSTGQITPGPSSESLEPETSNTPVPPVTSTPPEPDTTTVPKATPVPVSEATPLPKATPVPDTAAAVPDTCMPDAKAVPDSAPAPSKSPAALAVAAPLPKAATMSPVTANLAGVLSGGEGVMKPGDIISDELMKRMTDHCEKMDELEVAREFEMARAHAEFQAYVEGTRAEIGETGEEEDCWKFGEDIQDLVVFKGFVEARQKLRNALSVPTPTPPVHPALAKSKVAPPTRPEAKAPSVTLADTPQTPAAEPKAPAAPVTPVPETPAAPAATPAAPTTPAAPDATPATPALPARQPSDEEDEASLAAAAELEKKAARARYMKFYRNVRGPNCPDEVKDEFQKAMAEPNKQKSESMVAALYQKFCQCNGDWLESDIMLEHSRTHSTRNTDTWKWPLGY